MVGAALSTGSTAPQTSGTAVGELSVTYSLRINAEGQLDPLSPLEKGQSEP